MSLTGKGDCYPDSLLEVQDVTHVAGGTEAYLESCFLSPCFPKLCNSCSSILLSSTPQLPLFRKESCWLGRRQEEPCQSFLQASMQDNLSCPALRALSTTALIPTLGIRIPNEVGKDLCQTMHTDRDKPTIINTQLDLQPVVFVCYAFELGFCSDVLLGINLNSSSSD